MSRYPDPKSEFRMHLGQFFKKGFLITYRQNCFKVQFLRFSLRKKIKGSTIRSAFKTAYYAVLRFSTVRLASNFNSRGILFPFKFPFKMKTPSIFLSLLSAPYVGQTVLTHCLFRTLPMSSPIPEPKRINCHPWQFPSAFSLVPRIHAEPTNASHSGVTDLHLSVVGVSVMLSPV